MKVKLIQMTQNPIDVMWVAARTCYSAKSPIEMWEDLELYHNVVDELSKMEDIELITDKQEQIEKHWNLVKQVLDSGHQSIAETVVLTFSIEGVSRSLTHQLVRHRHGSYCVSGDTKIFQRSHGEQRTIKEIYEAKKQYNLLRRIRCVDEKTKELLYNPIKEVVYCGKKDVYEVETEFGYKIKSTMQHRYFTPEGWKTLEDLKVGDLVYVNGIEAYKNKEWLRNQYHTLNKSQASIAEYCGVSKHTIRAWVRKLNLQKEVGSWSVGVEPPNKGRTKNDYTPLKVVSEKMKGNHNLPRYSSMEEHPSYKGNHENITVSGGYSRTHRQNNKKGVCENCGRICKTHFHHINKDPRVYYSNNLLELCSYCHKAIHFKEIKKVIIPNRIISIKYVGVEDTYDISMGSTNHNYVANGFIVHNSQQSQRYVNFKDKTFEYVTPDTITKNDGAKIIYNEFMLKCKEYYDKLIDMNIPAEDARYVFPNAACTNINMTVNLRELIHISKLRLCNRASKEIRDLFKLIKKEVEARDERLASLLVPSCEVHNMCFEDKCCGRKPKLEEVLEGYERYKDLNR